ncbi:MAG TPA: UvrD-helicase domain-containing protein [Acidobacteriaceae bacterium]
MTATGTEPLVSDAAERARALDPRGSFLVQAPAGSGKTELLALRYLALLPTVDEPEQILAITFMRKAAAEMRARVLRALKSADLPEDPTGDHQREVRRLAKAALAHSEARSWNLIEQPQRLNIQTIDSLALSIAYQTPLLSRLGGKLTPTEDAKPLFALAAERTMAHLGSTSSPELTDALANILKLRDANLQDCETLIAGMLERRDQWLLLVPGIVQRDHPWEDLRTTLEEPFRRDHAAVVDALRAGFGQIPGALEELFELAQIAHQFGMDECAPLLRLRGPSDLVDAAHWQALSCLLLTKSGGWRKVSAIAAKNSQEASARFRVILDHLSANDTLFELLKAVRKLPPGAYSPEEWETVRSIFVVLRYAIAELRVVFAEQQVIDFAEAGIAARAALGSPNVVMRLEDQIQHLLVDEFQDTSRPNFALLRLLLDAWQPGDGRTCFFVGDPMQSIYLFRDAESRLFGQVREHGIDTESTHLPLHSLRLSTNFRSVPAIVNPLNRIFDPVLEPGGEDDVQFAPSVSSQAGTGGLPDTVHVHAQVWEKETATAEEINAAQADAVIATIEKHLPAIEQARRNRGRYRVAVLGRTRSHLAGIVRRLLDKEISFRAVKVDPLRERPEVLDLLSLLRALLHPADRIAWLSVLRAPWCGLEIPALHAISGDLPDDKRDLDIPALIRMHRDRLDSDSVRRVSHVLRTLEDAQAAYAAGALAGSPAGLALWLERTWEALGAPQFLNAESIANCEALFATLAQLPPSCFGTLDETLNQRLNELYAQPEPGASEDCGVQLMTIHGAKGLEFEVVIVPQLDRPGKTDPSPLFHWLVRRRPGCADEELLLAPIGYKHDDQPGLFNWVRKKSNRRLEEEEKRLLYVACSRAIHELHLFATVTRKREGALAPARRNSLLGAGWKGLEQRILEATRPSPDNLITMPGGASAPQTSNGVLPAIAAAASASEQRLRRLPSSWYEVPPSEALPDRLWEPGERRSLDESVGRLARVRGIVLHALLEQAAGKPRDPEHWGRLADALLRQHGLSRLDANSMRSIILQGLNNTFDHPECRWLLAASATPSWTESEWTTVSNGRILRQRPDRIFFGGASPAEPGAGYLWIVDYKTAPMPEHVSREDFLAAAREQYRRQLESYSALFRQLTSLDENAARREHRLAIYHPLLPWLDWWAD